MSLFKSVRDFVLDPPPAHLFEISQAGIAWSVEGRLGFEALPPGTLAIQPQTDNVQNLEALVVALRRIAPEPPGQKRRRPAALLLPDYAARITVLDFDSFPAKAAEQASLVRFRVKKSLPFDADAAALAYHPQQAESGARREVVIAAVSLEILSRYEAAMRAAGYHAGFVTVSSLAALDLLDPAPGLAVTARLSGRVLTITASTAGRLRLTRCIELTETNPDELSSVVVPTLAFVEDEYGLPIESLHLIGFGGADGPGTAWVNSLAGAQSVESPLGPVTGENAGLLGYLHSRREAPGRAA